MTESEKAVYDALTSVGWTVHTSGWPDFLAVRKNELRLIEVKTEGDEIRENQAAVHKLLKKHGLPVEIVRVRTDFIHTPTGLKRTYRPRGVFNDVKDVLRTRRT